MEYSIGAVCLLGMGIVFFGLICLVGLIRLMGLLCGEKPTKDSKTQDQGGAEVRIAIAAALAECLRVDYQDITITSIARHEEEI